jgi:hypothetical protein
MRNSQRHFTFVWLFLSFIPFTVFAKEANDSGNGAMVPPATSTDDTRRWFITGSASEQYRLRYAHDLTRFEFDRSGKLIEHSVSKSDSDQDLRLLLNGQLWDSRDQYSADVSMALWHDFDRSQIDDYAATFVSVNEGDTEKIGRDVLDVYSLYAEYHSPDWRALARGGRQTAEYGRPTTFDGATAKYTLLRPYLDAAIFGGRTVHFFETSGGLFESWLASAAVVVRPLLRLRIETDYRYSVEDTALRDSIRDSSYGVAVRFQTSDIVRVRAYARGLNDAFSNAGASAKLEWSQWQVGCNADIDSQLITLGEITEGNNPYFEVLGKSLPHLRVALDVWKKLATRVALFIADLGWQQRALVGYRSTPFNRNYGKIYLRLEADDIAVQGPFAELVVEYNDIFTNAGLAANSLFTVGGSAGYRRQPIHAIIGSYYYRYKYDYYVDVREFINVRGYFGEFRYDPLKWLSARLGYTFEQFDRSIHTVKLTVVETY